MLCMATRALDKEELAYSRATVKTVRINIVRAVQILRDDRAGTLELSAEAASSSDGKRRIHAMS